jgi:hypothetical protein
MRCEGNDLLNLVWNRVHWRVNTRAGKLNAAVTQGEEPLDQLNYYQLLRKRQLDLYFRKRDRK